MKILTVLLCVFVILPCAIPTIFCISVDFGIGTLVPAAWFSQILVPMSFIENNVFFYLYTRSKNKTPALLSVNNQDSLKKSGFDPSKKTVFIIHGFETNYLGDSVQEPKDEYLKHSDINVIAVDFGNINSNSLLTYMVVVTYSFQIGQYLGLFLQFLVNEGVHPDDIQIVGHSLGAHIAGFGGKYMRTLNKSIKRITALDPCYPGYNNNSPPLRLAVDDAQFTDCIFTNYGRMGMGFPVCQANFFPNGIDVSQPGCYFSDLLGGCSHSLVVQFFKESINPANTFSVHECSNVPSAQKLSDCWPIKGTQMGQYANSTYLGLFYLKTNISPPYSRG